ncbi:DUF938 domain-containing protein [Parasphingopyxis sp.]|uniref:DUF938 domain-containing protein n=1 Tax=Parasphingopyxis sp. TaxID=1920299 RepID=UPI0026097111|nr:DUF938 domain-containing protein [Parasphingopyxis sp.]
MEGNEISSVKRHAPATLRNREAIATVLQRILPDAGRVLEVASGSGEHIVYFADRFPELQWQPSDPDAASQASITAWSADAHLPNIEPVLDLDAASDRWPVASADAILCINMIHISPWAATEGLLKGAARLLRSGSLLYLYGPFLIPERETAPSNLDFDRSLKARNPHWGLRSIADIERAAAERDFVLQESVDMPANNLSLILHKR